MMENDLNFGEAVMKIGITRDVNGLEERVSLRLCVSARSFDVGSNPELFGAVWKPDVLRCDA